jgi:P27 family predicted phage terminase small subunit
LPKAELEDFPTPRWMTDEEKEMFEHLRGLLIGNNIIKKTDAFALSMLAQVYTEYLEICKLVAKDGHIIEVFSSSGNSQLKANPLLTERNRCFTASKELLREFGLTPSSRRAIIQADPNKASSDEEDEWDALLN